MRINYSKEVNKLFDLVKPYIDSSFPPKLKVDTPQEIKDAYERCMKLMSEEKQNYLAENGLV